MFIKFQGLTLGGDSGSLIITDFTAPTADIRNSYVDRLNTDGQMVSKDYLTKASWQFTVATNGSSLEDSIAYAHELQSRWQAPSVRNSTVAVEFQYSHDGEEWFSIFGKPQKFTSLVPNTHAKLGVGFLDFEFIQTDVRYYSAETNLTRIDAVQSSVGGIVAPIITPITTVSTGEDRAGRMTNTGDLDSPAVVTFYGPSSNPKLTTDKGYEIQYNGTLAYDQSVTLNPIEQSVRLSNGVDVPGRLSRKTRLSSLVIPSGDSEWFYRATDSTGTSYAEIEFRSAYSSFR